MKKDVHKIWVENKKRKQMTEHDIPAGYGAV
jgi:hypothetical protein